MLEIKNLTYKYKNEEKEALSDFTCNVEVNKTLAVLGKSGSGKSTMLRLISGLETPSIGEVIMNGEIMSSNDIHIKPEKRKIGYVFQDYALFPHMSVYENLEYPINKMKKNMRQEKIREMLKFVELEDCTNKYPHEISGGQQQRVALARTLIQEPEILLLDEPFSNLDIYLHNELRANMCDILDKINITTIIVTHDIEDVFEMADDIIVLKEGEIYFRKKVLDTTKEEIEKLF